MAAIPESAKHFMSGLIERARKLKKTIAFPEGTDPRVLFFLEHAIQDASLTRSGERRVVSKRLLFVEIDAQGTARHLNYSPYLDYRPLAPVEPAAEAFLVRPECARIARRDRATQPRSHRGSLHTLV